MSANALGLGLPAQVGRYEALLPIGRGGMARVYLGRVQGIGGFERLVALKVMHEHLRDEPEFVRAFLAEAKLAARLRHPNIVSVLDAGHCDLGVYLAMDYVEGDTLSGLVHKASERGATVPIGIALRVLGDALIGLHETHELRDNGVLIGLVHRDFSPQNILVGVDGIARLTDFGVAKVTNAAGGTETGFIKGKLGYMSPEQARGRKLDRRADIWSAGVVAWELLTGVRLYPRGDDAATLLRIVSGKPTPLRAVRPDLDPAIEACVARALAPDTRERWESAEEFRRGLIDAWGGPIADVADVAAYVRREVAGTLEERARQISLRAEESPSRRAAVAPTLSAPRARFGKRRIGAAVALCTVAAGSVAWALHARTRPAAVASAPPLPPVGTTSTGPPIPEEPPAPPPPAAATVAAAAPSVRLVANAPVARLMVARRAIVPITPSKEISVTLAPAEAKRVIHVVAVSNDGRRANLDLPAGASSAVLRFDPPPKPRSAASVPELLPDTLRTP
jgi:serine/threonine-protein kinase